MTTLDPRALIETLHAAKDRLQFGFASDREINQKVIAQIDTLLAALSQPQAGETVADAVTAELLAEHSGCGNGIQIEQVTAKLAPGDAVYVVRGKLGQALIVPKSDRIVTLYADPAASAPHASAPERVSLHGPFGWLNGCRGLSEDSWSLESDPLENSEEYFAIPLYALTDPFKEIGPLYASPQPALAVKGLEWEDRWSNSNSTSSRTKRRIMERALTAFGSYFIEQSADDDTWWLLDAMMGDEIGGPFDEVWRAHAAAQADYETRIRSALVASPPPSGEVLQLSIGVVDTLIESLSEGLMTDAGLSKADRAGMKHQITALEIAKEGIASLSVAPATADGWRTMEDAPKDGTEILLCLPRQCGVRVLARWNRVHSYWLSLTSGRPVSLCNDDLWMPLPAAPTATGGR